VLLAASVALLIPGIRARPEVSTRIGSPKRLRLGVAAAAVVFAALPLAAVAALPPLHDGGSRAVQLDISLLPVSAALEPKATPGSDSVTLSWRATPPRAGRVFYRIFRGNQDDVACGGRLGNAADDCRLYANQIGVTRARTFVDHPPRGAWSYRIGVSANWLNDTTLGDVFVLSTPVSVNSG
jgi:hypothetical protein